MSAQEFLVKWGASDLSGVNTAQAALEKAIQDSKGAGTGITGSALAMGIPLLLGGAHGVKNREAISNLFKNLKGERAGMRNMLRTELRNVPGAYGKGGTEALKNYHKGIAANRGAGELAYTDMEALANDPRASAEAAKQMMEHGNPLSWRQRQKDLLRLKTGLTFGHGGTAGEAVRALGGPVATTAGGMLGGGIIDSMVDSNLKDKAKENITQRFNDVQNEIAKYENSKTWWDRLLEWIGVRQDPFQGNYR